MKRGDFLMATNKRNRRKKNVSINYTSREFETIREDLVNYARRYYPNTYQDFNEAGFGSLMLDTVAYVGDLLSFYLDYQANETFLDTANEYENIRKIGKQLGYKFQGRPSSFGRVSLFITVPAASIGAGPDERYLPVIKRGTTFSSADGAGYILNEDVFFNEELNEIVVAEVDSSTGKPLSYAVKSEGQIVSGEMTVEEIEVDEFEKFLKVKIDDSNFSEIISVFDADGNEYFQVDNLSQNIIYRSVANRGRTSLEAASVLKPFVVPRRFVTEFDGESFFLQFGFGSDVETESTTDKIFDPANVVLDLHGKDYVSDTSFDPTKLISSDKFGIAPGRTTLEVIYRKNTDESANAPVDTITETQNVEFVFDDENIINSTIAADVIESLEVTNDEPITGDISLLDTEELRQKIFDSYASQNRAVTAQDYQSVIYSMPPKFGAIKRAKVIQDADSLKRNLNIYIISEDSEDNLTQTNNVIKENLKTWLNQYRMINDSLDILDAKIVNLGIDFVIMADFEKNKYDVLQDAVDTLKESFLYTFDISEPFYITDIYKTLRDVEGVVDVVDVKVKSKTGGLYSSTSLDLKGRTSPDGRYLSAPQNVIFEIKFPDSDIKGVIK